MARKLDGSYITANTITTTQLTTTVVTQISAGGGPKVATITYPNSATAAVNTGNESIVLTGTGFDAGVQVYINGAAAPSVSRTNSTSLSFTTPALTTGTTYPLYVVNPDGGTAVVVPGMVVSAGPVWVTNSPLSSWGVSSALSRTLVANSDSTVSYALAAGSSLPSGLSLAANGLLSGTLTSPPASDTTYNFTVVATDLETQKSSKAFSITATIGITAATGGTVSNISGYRVHTFTSSGTFQVTSGAGTVEYLVVAGGGGGGAIHGGGGGAGGFRTGSGYSVSAPGSYTVTVGAGGPGGTGSSRGQGSDSVFDTITSAGGGGGGSYAPSPLHIGANGGSGGGGGWGTGASYPSAAGGSGNTPSTSPSQGNNGGSSLHPGSGVSGGGGGGAGAAGANATSNGGNGGNGAASSISGSSVTYAGGGGGSGDNRLGSAGSGGTGGGGAGSSSGSPVAGTVNTGGGGGAAGYPNQTNGAAGGSGIVIIRYAV